MVSPQIDDRFSLRAITPVALSSYARSEGWAKVGAYRQYSDVYAADGKPEIIVPHTDVIDDYAMVVSDLVSIFAKVLHRDEASVYRDLMVADRDVLRVRVIDTDPNGLSVEISHELIRGTRSMLLAAAHSLGDSRPVYRTSASSEAADYLSRVRLRNTERGSFALILVSPAVAPRLKPSLISEDDDAPPKDRLVAQRLSESLFAARDAVDSAVAGDADAFENATASGVSANLCESVAGLVQSVSSFDVSFSWAMTRPSTSLRGPVAFSYGDLSILEEAALSFRASEPDYDRTLSGFIYRLTRNHIDIDGTVALRTSYDGDTRSVVAVLSQRDYAQAIKAHKSNSIVYLKGDLELVGNRMHLRNARLVDVVQAPTLQGLDVE